MSGYTRQSVADIIANAVIKAAPVNAEFNALRDAFAASTGHRHDGDTGEGGFVPLIADLDGNNRVTVDTINNRISVFVEVGGTQVEQLRIQDGVIVPVTDNDIDLGTSSLEFKDLYIDGIAKIDTLTVDENATITGDLTVNGNTAIGNSATDTVTVNADVASNLIPDADSTRTLGDASNYWQHGYIDAVTTTGNATVGGNLSVTGTTALTGTATITSADINSGAMDNVTIGASTPVAGTFTNLTSTGTSTHATVDINGGAIDGTTIGASTPAAITGTTITSTGLGTFPTVNIDGGAIDGTTIGATSAGAGSFTTVTTSGQATLATADINGGTIDGVVIGGASAAAITGTTITGTSLVGPLTGAVTGNVTGNLTGNVTGNVTGNLTGNVTAASGSSTFTDVTINGTLNMNAGTTATITNLTSPTNTNDAATKGYVDTSISNLVDAAPGTLDTLNELAAALGDDPNFATTVTDSIATKLPLAGGTMTGAIVMSTNKITGMGDPTANQDAATKAYVDTGDAAQLSLTGGTMTGAIDMGANKITTTYTPTNAADLTTKTYVDAILGSATSAAASAAAAATSESNAATSETNAANSASAAATSEANAAASYDSFDDRYLGAKASAPTLDNDGDALLIGALYFNTVQSIMYVYSAAGWVPAGSSVNGTSDRVTYTATSGQTVFAATYDTGYVDVYLNGVKLIAGTDFTATNGTSITLTTGAATGDTVDIVAYGTFVLADHYTEAQSDARFVNVTGDTMTGALAIDGNLTVDTNTLFVDAAGNRVGIGTTSPNVRTEVGGTDAIVALRVNTENAGVSASNYSEIQLSDNGAVRSYWRNLRDGSGATHFAYGDHLAFLSGSGASERLRITSTGNVGIGTSSPAVKLEVLRGSEGEYLRIGGDDTGDNGRGLRFTSSTGGGFIGALHTLNAPSSGGTIAFATASTERLRITSTGSVGIGTSSPAAALEVTGDIQQTWATSMDRFVGSKFSTSYELGLHLLEATRETRIVSKAADSTGLVSFYTGTTPTERARIDASGNVGIGTSSIASNTRLAVVGPRVGNDVGDSTQLLMNTATTISDRLTINFSMNGVAGRARAGIGAVSLDAGGYNCGLAFYTRSALDSSALGVADERARIDSSGNLLVGKTVTTFTTDGLWNQPNGTYWASRTSDISLVLNRNGTDGQTAQFYKAGSQVGNISVTASSTAYNTSSDYRLKEDVQPMVGATDRLMALKPVNFAWKVDGSRVDGFLAHEAQEVVPEAVTGSKDAMREEEYEVTPAVYDDEGNLVSEAVRGTREVPEYQGIDQSKIVPLLTAALQEALNRIETLEADMAALKGA